MFGFVAACVVAVATVSTINNVTPIATSVSAASDAV